MMSTLKQVARIRAAMWVNTWIYYFQKLWLVGRLAPDSLYQNQGLKRALSAIALVLRQLVELAGKPIYLALMVIWPLSMLPAGDGRMDAAVQILFFLNCVLAPLSDSQVFSVTRAKITCLTYMGMDARRYVQSHLALKYVPFFLFYLPWLMALCAMNGGALWQGVSLMLVLFGFRMLGEAAQVYHFYRTGKVLSRSTGFEWAMIALCLLLAYGPLALGWRLPLAALLHPLAALLCALMGGACLYYILVGYKGYESEYRRSLDMNFLFSTIMKSAGSSSFAQVEIKERDLKISQGLKSRINRLKGYRYLNALFFARHRRQLIKPVYYRLAVAGGILLAGVFFWATQRQAAVALSRNLTVLLPSFVFVMYAMTVADKASRAMFYNCDKNLLRYSDYRRPSVILDNFRIRLIRVGLYDLAIAAAVCLAALVFCALCGSALGMDFLLFCAAILLLSVLFTVHHLCLYYLCQPYAQSLNMKNPYFSFVNGAMYMLCFLCMRIKAGAPTFTASVFIFTLAYTLAALALVYRLAPKTFRIK